MGKISLQVEKLKVFFARVWGDKYLEALPEETTNLAFSRASSEDSLVTCEESWTASNIDVDEILRGETEEGTHKALFDSVVGFLSCTGNSFNTNCNLAIEESLQKHCCNNTPQKEVKGYTSDNKIVDAIEQMIELINNYPDSFPDLPFADWEYDYVNSAAEVLPAFTDHYGPVKEANAMEYIYENEKKASDLLSEVDKSKGPFYILNLPSALIGKTPWSQNSRKLLLKKKRTDSHNNIAPF